MNLFDFYQTFITKPDFRYLENKKILILDDLPLKYRPVKMPRGTILFRSAKWQNSQINALNYNKSKDARYYGEIPVASMYLDLPINPNTDLYAIWFNDLRLVDIRTFPSVIDNSINFYIQEKLDLIYENEPVMDFCDKNRINPLHFLRVKKGQKTILTQDCALDLPAEYGLDTYLDTDFLIGYIAFKICYGTTPASSLEDYINSFNQLLRENPKERYDPIDIRWISNMLQLDAAGFKDKDLFGCGKIINYIPVKYRNSIRALDDISVKFMKELCQHSGIDGYYSPRMKIPWGLKRAHGRNQSRSFHAEVCVFDPESKIENVQQMFGGVDYNTYNNRFFIPNYGNGVKLDNVLQNMYNYENLKRINSELFIKLSELPYSLRMPKLMLKNNNTQFGGALNNNFSQLSKNISFEKKIKTSNHFLNLVRILY